MSLFGSLYDDDDERGADGDAAAPPEAEPAAAPANGVAPPGAASPDEGLPEVDVPADDPDDRDGAEEAPTPAAALDIDAPSMSLQDFAAQMFDGSAGDGAADDGDPSDEPVSIEVADDLDGGFAALSTGEAGADTHDDPQPNPEPEPEIEVPALGEPASVEAPPDESSDASPDDASDDASVEAPSGFSSLFGDDDDTSSPDESGPAPTGPSGEASPGTAPRTAQPTGSIASAASDLADLAKSPVATLDPPSADDDSDSDADDAPSGELDETSTSEPADEPIDFGEPLLIDDLLPSAKPGGGPSLPSLSGRIPVKLVAVLLVAALAGFLGMRMLGGGSGDDPAAESSGSAEAAAPADDPGSETSRSPGEVLDRAQEAGAEVELRNATIAAQAEYASSGTFARSAADWDAVIPEAQVADASAPARDIVSVVSDDDAVCFETLLQNGTTVAAGVTATAMGFEQDPGGDSICTADAAVIEGWAPSLSGL